jgi:hypothetical protein
LQTKSPAAALPARPSIARGFFVSKQLLQLGAGAAANRRVVEADVAAAAALAALLQAVAASLNHGAAFLVAAVAADAAAILRVFTLALTAGEVHLAALNAVLRAAAAAQPIAQHAAQILQRATGDFVIAAAMNLAASLRLFEFDRATRQHAPVRICRRASRILSWLDALDRARERRNSRRTTFQ